MMQQARRIGFGLITTLAIVGFAVRPRQRTSAFEVSSIKAVKATLVETAAALQQGNIAKAKEAFRQLRFGLERRRGLYRHPQQADV